MPDVLEFNSVDETSTESLGRALAAALAPSAVVGLIGPLGAGKTRFVQAVARAAGVEEGIVASPTFVLVHEYAGRLPIFHFDAYRLRNANEFLALGPEEYFSQPGWTFIEWADRVSTCLPRDRLEITIVPTSPTARRFTFRASGSQYEQIIAALSSSFSNS